MYGMSHVCWAIILDLTPPIIPWRTCQHMIVGNTAVRPWSNDPALPQDIEAASEAVALPMVIVLQMPNDTSESIGCSVS